MISRLTRISYRLPAIIALAVALSAIAIGTYSYMESSKEVRRQATQKLVALRDARHAALTRYFRSIEEDLALLAANTQVSTAMADFRAAFGQIDQANRFEEEQALRRIYTPEATRGKRSEIRGQLSTGVTAYVHAHNRHHDWFETATKLKGYYDLFLISPTGDVIYTMFKEPDFASNLAFGAWSDTGLAQAFKAGMRAQLGTQPAFVDFKPYEPSAGDPAAFIARKVVREGKTLGLLVLQMPIKRINKVMQVTAGMGETGEIYVVGSDHLMHSDSRFSDESTILKTAVRTPAVDRALNGDIGVDTIADYRGVPVVSAYRPFIFLGAKWALIAEIDVAEVQAPIDTMRDSIVFIGLGLSLLVAAIGMLLAGSITRPLAALSDSIKTFRETRIAETLPQAERKDEIGEIARGFQTAAKEITEYIDFINVAREELTQGEADLRDREERISSLLEVSPLGFTLVRPDGEVLLTNAAIRRIVGHSFGVGTKVSAAEFYRNPEDRAQFVETLRTEGEISAYEVEWKRVDGTPIWVVLSSKLIDFDGGRAFLTWVDDITDRKRAEMELAAQEKVLRLSFDTMSDGIYVLDADLNYALFNDRYLEMMDLPSGAVAAGAPVENAIRAHAARGDYGAGDVEELVARRMQRLGDGEYIHTEMAVDNAKRVIDLRKAAIEGGGAVVVTRDITERKQAEAEIAQQKALLEVTLETMDQGITMIDADLDVMAFNTKFLELLEFPPDQFTPGTPLADFFRYNADRGEYGDGDGEAQVAERLDLASKFEAHHFERTRPDGMVMEIRGNPLPEQKGFVTTYTDITQRKRAEAQIAAKEAQLRMALENMPGAMWVVDDDLRIVLFNDQYLEFYGDYGGLMTVGNSMVDVIRAEANAGLLSGASGEIEAVVQERIDSYRSDAVSVFDDRTTDGRHVQLVRKRGADGFVVSVATDITERKQAEEELTRQKTILELVLDAMDQGLTMFDGDYKLTMYNSKAPDLLDTPEHLVKLGTPFQDWYRNTARTVAERTGVAVSEAEIENRLEIQIDSIRAGTPSIYERPASGDRTVEIRRNPIDGGGFVSTFTDISERKKAERIIANAMSLINESIQYASKIQRSLLPTEADMKAAFKSHAVVWEPKDVVGGDIYHLRPCDKGNILMVADCTGHGVPGAFMTMIVTGALDQALIEIPDGDPAALLKRINQLVKTTLGQDSDHGESDDGFECGLCLVTDDRKRLTYAGARFELWRLNGEGIDVIKGDKTGIGYRRTAGNRSFSNHTFELAAKDTFYIVSDGLVDQVGGDKRRAFGKRRIQATVLAQAKKSLAVQKAHVMKAFAAHQGDEDRRDDVTWVAFRP